MVQPTNKGLFLELGIDDSSFKSGLTGINQQLKSAQTQFQAFSKIAQASGDSLDNLKNQTTAYQRVVDVQKKKVAELEKQFKEQQKVVEGNAQATQKDKDKLIRLANQYNQAKGNLAQYESKLESLNNKYKDASTVTEKTVSEYDKVNKELKLSQTAFDIATASVDRNNKKTKDLLNISNSFKQVVENQRKKVSLLKDEYDKIEKSVKNNANATEEDQDNLIKQGRAYSKALSELNNYEKKLENLNKEYKTTARSQNVFHKSLSSIDNAVKKSLAGMDNLGKSIAGAGKKMTALTTAGVSATLAGATKSANEFADASSKIKVRTGATKEEIKSMESAVKQAYTGTFAESADQASEAVATIYNNIGQLDQAELNNVTNAMLVMEKNGSDMDENIRGLKAMMDSFGLSATEAVDLMSEGFQQGLDKTHELGDNMAEYAQQWQQLGFTGAETFDMLNNGLNAGGYNLDKINDLVKEMGISLNDGRMEDNLNSFSQATQKAFLAYKNGSGDAKTVIRGMISDITSMENKQKAAALASTMWSSLGEDNALKVLKSLNITSKGYENVKGASQRMVKDSSTDFDKMKSAMRELQVALIPLGTAVAQALVPIANKITDLVDKFKKLPKSQQESIAKFASLGLAVGPVVVVLGKFVSSISKITKGLYGGGKALFSFISKAKNGESAVWNFTKKLGGLAGKGVKSAFSFLKGSFSSLTESAKKVGKGIGSLTKNIAGLAGKSAKKGIEAVKGGLSGIKEKAKETTSKLGDISKKIVSFAGDKIKNGLSSVKGGLSGIRDKAKEATSKMGDITTKITSWTSDKVKNAFTSIKDNLSHVKRKAGEASTNVGDINKNATKKTKGGFFSGLLGSLSRLASKSKIVQFAIKGIGTVLSVLTGPVGIAVGAIALIGGAFVLAYKKCKPFRDFINRIGSWFKEKFDVAIKWAKDFGKRLVDNVVNKSVNPISVAVKGWKIAKYFKGRFDKARKEGDSFGTALKKAMGDTIGNISSKVKNWKIVKWFSDKWSSVKQKTADFKENLGTKFNELKGSLSEKIKSWSIVKWFSDKWSSVKSKTETFKKEMGKKIGDLVENIAKTVRESKIGKAFSEAFNKAKELVAKPVNGIIHGANWVIHKLGGPEKTIDDWNPSKYANGTPKGGHPGGLAMVNDEKGATYREAVTLPNGRTFIPNGRNVVMNLPKGTQVANAKTTRNALNSGILRYKDGTDESWLSKAWNFGKKAVSKIGDVIGDIMDYATNPGKLVRKVMENFVNFGKLLDFPLDLGKGILRKGIQALTNKVKEMFESMESDDGGDFGAHGDLGSNKWFQIHGNWVREWQYRLLEPIIKQYHFRVTDGGRRTWDNYDHSKGQAMDIAIGGNPLGIYWKVAQQIDKMPFVKYVNSNMKSSYGHKGKFTPSNLEPRADHIHVSFTKQFLSAKELKASSGNAGGSMGNPGGAGVQRWRPYVIKALKANGLPTTSEYVNAWLRQIQTESGGDPKATQHGYVDINTLTGNLARGLLQTIPPTFNAHKFPGHGNIYNGYDNMLAAIHYAKAKYGTRGMLQVIGHGHGYEKGGLVTTHQMAQIAEGNKPEMVIPLTNKSRSVQLINKARKLIGEDDIQTDTSELREQNRELKAMNEKLSSMIDLLGALLSKDNNIYMDGREFARVGAKPIQNEVNRMNINQNRLRGIG